MELADLISHDGIVPLLRAKDKKQALQELAEKAAALTGLSDRIIFDALWQRERLGSTGVGRRIAIPHCRLAQLKRIACVFARLETAIPFDSPDGEPVDLIFLLLAPEQAGADHLKALARISRLVREPAMADRLRACRDRAAILSVMMEPAAGSGKPLPLAG